MVVVGAYADRLNALFTPAGWTRKYAIHYQRQLRAQQRPEDRDQGQVTCELMIFGLG
jgi:hypothetical protein